MAKKKLVDVINEATEQQSPKAAVTSAINAPGKFDLNKYKKSKNLAAKSSFKKDQFLPLSDAFNKAISLPGLIMGGINVLRGHSDTGKTLAMVEAAMSSQKLGRLPVFIITEMKWRWDRAIAMGFNAEQVVDEETGELTYAGNFIYVDRSSLSTIEDVAGFISELLDEQEKGKLPYALDIFWDSVGSIPCLQSVQSGKNNAMWNAGAMSTQFGNFINQRFAMSRKTESKYTNTFIVVNQIRVEYPIANPMEKPKMRNKCGDAMYWAADLVVTFGNITNSGVSKIEATRDGRKIVFAKRTKVSVDKNHVTEATTSARIVMTAHGFIEDTEKALNDYKKTHKKEWLSVLGGEDFDVVQEDDMQEDMRDAKQFIMSDSEGGDDE